MPVLDERHDFSHPVEGDTAWSESYYFNAYDPDLDAGIFSRVGIRPNEGTIDGGLAVWLPGGGVAHIRGSREQRQMIDAPLEVGPVRYEREEPMRVWRLTAASEAAPVVDLAGSPIGQANIEVDVTFTALTPAIGTDGQDRQGTGASAATGEVVGKGHLEQAGRWTGWIQVDGVRHELGPEARGNRDKSWGPRRWGGPKMWRWFSINIGDDVHFGGIRIGTDRGDLHRGWVWKDGSHASIRNWDVVSELEDDGVTHRVSHVKATDSLGRVHELHGFMLRMAPGRSGIKANTTLINEGLARWDYEGRIGYGVSEYLHQLDADAVPVVAIE